LRGSLKRPLEVSAKDPWGMRKCWLPLVSTFENLEVLTISNTAGHHLFDFRVTKSFLHVHGPT